MGLLCSTFLHFVFFNLLGSLAQNIGCLVYVYLYTKEIRHVLATWGLYFLLLSVVLRMDFCVTSAG